MKTKAIFESFMQEHGVPRSGQAVSGLSFSWLDDAPEGEDIVGSYGRVFDLIVLSRPDATSLGLHHRALESGLFESGRPILLSPPSPPKQIATNVLIAWNGSTEQTRAIAFAMPLLQQAERVKVLTIPGGAGVPGPSGEQLTRSLQRNGIPATPLTVELDGRSTGETILATAASAGLRSPDQGSLHPKPPEGVDLRGSNSPHPGQRNAARLHGALISLRPVAGQISLPRSSPPFRYAGRERTERDLPNVAV